MFHPDIIIGIPSGQSYSTKQIIIRELRDRYGPRIPDLGDVSDFDNLPEKAGNNVSMSWLVWMRMMKETTLSKLGDRGMNWSVILSRNWKCRNTITERSNQVKKVKWGHFKLTLNLSIQDVLDMIGVVSGMNNERNGVCARLKIHFNIRWIKT